MIEEAIFEILNTDPRLGPILSGRIWPLERDQGEPLPAVTFQRSGGARDYDMEGGTGLVESRFLLFFWAEKTAGMSAYLGAKTIKRLTVERFSPQGGFRETVGTTEIQGIFINSEDDGRADGATGSGVARVVLDCTFWHKERT